MADRFGAEYKECVRKTWRSALAAVAARKPTGERLDYREAPSGDPIPLYTVMKVRVGKGFQVRCAASTKVAQQLEIRW